MNPKEIIEQIAEEKRRQFNSGNDLRNALSVIVDKLNSQETHFLLELIQNADDALKGAEKDNTYKLSFFLKQDRLIIQNTGRPFNKNDVRGLSSIGDSHKDLDQIGHFGIGFKSVFRICNYPEIHSGGFSFRYNAKDETWIVPEWLDTPLEEYNKAPTTFVLPFKEPDRHFELIKKQINQLDPRILLFLNHLRRIESDGLLLERQDLGKDACLLTRNGEHSTWKIYRAELRVPPKPLEELRRLRGEKAAKKKKERIVIAIRLEENGKNIDLQRKGCIFAFLPTRHELQFPFDLHADFEVNAERTALVDPERGWNHWIFGKVWSTFLPFFEDCKKGTLSIADFYGVLPNSEDLKNTAVEIKPAIQEGMKSKIDSVFASYKTVKTINSCWHIPKETILDNTKFVNLFSDLPPLNESEKPLHYSLTEIPGRAQIFLREHTYCLSKNHVISTLKRIQGPNRPIDWHERVIIYLANFKDKLDYYEKSSFAEALKNMPILPTTTGVISASCDKGFRVFRLPEKEESIPLGLFEERCRFLDINLAKRFIESKGNEDRSLWQARNLLTELSPEITVQKLYDEFVSPIFKEEKRSDVNNEERLLKLTKFVKDYSSSLKKLDIKLKSLSGKFVDPEQLYLTSSYDRDCPFEKLINAKDRLISDDYLNLDDKQSMNERRTQWCNFLIKIGINRIPKVTEQKPIEINKKELEIRLDASDKESTTRGYKIIENELDPEICLIFEGNNLYNLQNRIERAKILIKLFNDNWTSYEKNLKAHYQFHIRRAEEWPTEELGSSKFARWLLETKWIPTKPDKLCSSSEVVESEEKVAVAISPAFEEFLFGTALNLNTLCNRLFETIGQKLTDPKSYYELYKQIHKSWRKTDEDEQNRITELLKKQSSIFLDKPQPIWLKPTEVVWQSPSWLQSTTLIKIYGKNCKVWFTEVFNVPERPTPKHFIEFASNNIWNKDLEPETRYIWQKILSKLDEILDENPELFPEDDYVAWLKQHLKLFCIHYGWISAQESLFYIDCETSPEIEANASKMCIIQKLGEEPSFPTLYEALGILPISTTCPPSDGNESEKKPPIDRNPQVKYVPPSPASCSPETASLNCCNWKPENELSFKKDSQALGKKQGISGSNISDAERRSIGDWGEELVFHWERKRLKECGQQHLAEKVEWKSKYPNRYHPFDVHSFDLDENGNWNPIEIEVKSTPYPSGETGILSNNQWEYANANADKHQLYIVYSAKSDKPVVRKLKFGEWVITPHTYNIIC